MNKVERIFDFISNWSNVPENLQRAFEKWLVAHSDEPEVDRAMENLWNVNETVYDPEVNLEGLLKLKKSIKRNKKTPRRRFCLRLGQVAAVLLLMACGYAGATLLQKNDDRVILLSGEESASGFTLPDGSHVWLNGGSRLEYPAAFDGKTREVKLSGEAYFDVQKDPSRPFRVEMNNMNVEVLGTSFNAIGYESEDYNELVLRSGSVRITGLPLKKDIILRPNERLRYAHTDGSVTVDFVNAENYCHWFEPRLIFDSSRISDILVNLERRFHTKIEMPMSVSADTRLSFTVYRESVDEVMEMMGKLLKLRYRIVDGRVIFSPIADGSSQSAKR